MKPEEIIQYENSKWVKTSEKMPENSNRIITWDGELVQEGYYSLAERRIVIPNYKFNNKITHWQPLPEKPL